MSNPTLIRKTPRIITVSDIPDDPSPCESGHSELCFCTRCGAALDDQPGFSPELDTWFCIECGQHLSNPSHDDIYEGEAYPDVMWYCDSCQSLLNTQPGFSDLKPDWICAKCGYHNKLNLIIEFKNPLW